jgi:hypothetical protein
MLAYPQAVRPGEGCLLASVRVMTTRCSRCLIKPIRIVVAGTHENGITPSGSTSR